MQLHDRMGDFSGYDELREVGVGVTADLYFYSYMFMFILILLNVFVAIVCYAPVKLFA